MNNIIEIMNFNLNDYMNDITQVIQEMTREKVINNIASVFEQYRDEIITGNDREIELLKAVKPFMNHHHSQNLDVAAQMLSNYKTLKHIVNDLSQVEVRSQSVERASGNQTNNRSQQVSMQGDLIEENNTIYEIDQDCEKKINIASTIPINIMPIMLIILFSMMRE